MVMSRSVEFNDVCGEVSVCLYKGWGVALHLCLLKSVTSGLLSGEDDVWGRDAHSEGGVLEIGSLIIFYLYMNEHIHTLDQQRTSEQTAAEWTRRLP